MTKLFNDNQLKSLAVPTVQMTHHQLQLKRALLSSSQDKMAKPHQLKRGWKRIMSKKPLTAAGITVAAAAMVVTIGAFNTPQNSAAYAQGIAKQSAAAVSKMTPDEKKKMIDSGHITSNIEDELTQAQKAKDAKSMTYEEVSKQYPMLLQPPPKKAGDGEVDFHKLKFIKYTDSDGNVKVLGVGEGSEPVMIVAMVSGSHGEGGGKPADQSFGSASGFGSKLFMTQHEDENGPSGTISGSAPALVGPGSGAPESGTVKKGD